jgi:D-arabinose 1-dehydrogenase-like Zn-dependent alcohol dehydrogenase
MGFVVAAISSGSDKAELAKKLGADLYIDASKESVVEELQKRGGARYLSYPLSCLLFAAPS